MVYSKERAAEYAREWRRKNPDKVRVHEQRKRAKQKPGAATERVRKWREANPEKVKAQTERMFARMKERRAADPAYAEHLRVLQRRSRAKNIDKVRETQREWHKRDRQLNPTKIRHVRILRTYGLTPEQFDTILASQNGVCGICLTDTPEGRGWHVDHCHKTGAIRGILCTKCNTGGGLFNDNKALLLKAAEWFGRGEDEPNP